MIQGRPGVASDFGNGVFGHPEPEEVTDLILLAVEARNAVLSLGPPEFLAGGPGFGVTFTGALRDQVALDFGEQGEERRHDLGWMSCLPSMRICSLMAMKAMPSLASVSSIAAAWPSERPSRESSLRTSRSSGFESVHQVVEPIMVGNC